MLLNFGLNLHTHLNVVPLVYRLYIPGVPEQAERWIVSILRAEGVIYFYTII